MVGNLCGEVVFYRKIEQTLMILRYGDMKGMKRMRIIG